VASAIPVCLVIRSAFAREGLRRILIDHGFEVRQSVAQLGALDAATCQDEHLVIFDGAPLPSETSRALREILGSNPRNRLVLINDTFNFELMNQAFRDGVHAYVLQDIQLESLLSIIQLVSLGEKVAPTEFIDHLQDITPNHGDHDFAKIHDLSSREMEVLDCLIMGMPNKLISRELSLSEATVKLTVKNIFRKLDVKNRTQAAILGREATEAAHSQENGTAELHNDPSEDR